jgi:hypothetical protein
MQKMEPQNTPNTPMDACQDRLDTLSQQIVDCALTVVRTLGTAPARFHPMDDIDSCPVSAHEAAQRI